MSPHYCLSQVARGTRAAVFPYYLVSQSTPTRADSPSSAPPCPSPANNLCCTTCLKLFFEHSTPNMCTFVYELYTHPKVNPHNKYQQSFFFFYSLDIHKTPLDVLRSMHAWQPLPSGEKVLSLPPCSVPLWCRTQSTIRRGWSQRCWRKRPAWAEIRERWEGPGEPLGGCRGAGRAVFRSV